MLGGLITYALLACLATALVLAAATDITRREIDNWLNAAIALGAPLYWLATGLSWPAIGFQVILAASTLAATGTLFAARQMGGGDVKLLTALALWFVPGSFLHLVMLMAVLGGAASVALAVYNMARMPGEAMRDAVGTAAAALWVLGACSVAYSIATGHPLIAPNGAASIASVVPRRLLLVLVTLTLAGVVFVGLRHVFRRQQGRIAMPYGVAIAAAGLWVLGSTTLA